MRVAVLINPVSGIQHRTDSARHRVALARAFLTNVRIEHEVSVSEHAGHAYELAREAIQRGVSLVFAWGGDGTMNEVARALVFSPATLALIPAGSGNGLARELHIPFDPEQALKTGLQGADRVIDVGEIGGHLFFNAAGVGFDAHVTTIFNNRPKKRRGLLSYVTIAARELFSYQSDEYAITIDGETMHRHSLLIALANSRQYGNGALVAPHADLSDGRLDLVVIHSRSPFATLWETRHLFNGTITQRPGVETQRIRHATIVGHRPLCLHVDGEPVVNTATSLTVRLHPFSLRVKSGADYVA